MITAHAVNKNEWNERKVKKAQRNRNNTRSKRETEKLLYPKKGVVLLKTVLIVILSALASLIAIPVGDGGFRITFGIVVLITALHVFKPKNPITLGVITGLAVCTVRILFDSISMDMTASLASSYFLELSFYIAYPILYRLVFLTNTSKYPLPQVVSLVLCDTGSNAIEYSLRTLAGNVIWDTTSIYTILLAAFVRSVLIIMGVWLMEHFVLNKTSDRMSA